MYPQATYQTQPGRFSVRDPYGMKIIPSLLLIVSLLQNCMLQAQRQWAVSDSTTYALGGDTLLIASRKQLYRSVSGVPTLLRDFTNAADKAAHDRMVKLVDTMLQLQPKLAAAKSAHDRDMLQRQIDATDRQIDVLVYQLYGLTQDEIKVVEGA